MIYRYRNSNAAIEVVETSGNVGEPCAKFSIENGDAGCSIVVDVTNARAIGRKLIEYADRVDPQTVGPSTVTASRPKPTIGRIVRFEHAAQGPCAALVIDVHEDASTVSLRVFPPSGCDFDKHVVPFSETPRVDNWNWPPRE